MVVRLAMLAFAIFLVSLPVRAAEPIDFVRDVRPILQSHCYSCHGETKQKSGLRLDLKASALKDGDSHAPVLVPGKAKASPLFKMVVAKDDAEAMPPGGKRLSTAEVAVLERWIDGGAHWPDGVDHAKVEDRRDHWSFKPLRAIAEPASIDAFLAAKLLGAGLSLSKPAARAVWLRRVSLDLTGLPPSPEQVRAFENDANPKAFERIVDELLGSPRYGERWAQHWLDVVRYADTHGFEVNTERPNAWPYRDYVIRAFNEDTPYDRFIREQIAGDTLGKDAATGFLVTASVLLPGQIGKDEPSIRLARQDSLDEIVNNIGQTFLGLSVGCARCHDHKFDPITAKDYYAMQAFVAGVEYEDRDVRSPEADAARAELKKQRERLRDLDQQLRQFSPDGKPFDPKKPGAFKTRGLAIKDQAEAERLLTERKALDAQIRRAEAAWKIFAGSFRTPDVIRLLNRGDPEQPKDEVAPAIIAAFGEKTFAKTLAERERRIALAEWVASPANPLTARVMVNRIWQGHFGTGLVSTPSDFGRNGVKPTHPELLDWLAAEFIRAGWSVKHLHRLIVLSEAYRQSSQSHAEGLAKDADVRLLWRFPSRRLEAESIRDAMLAVSGKLNLTMYGRGFDLFDKRGGLTGFKPVESFTGDGLRRMIYAHKVRRETEAVFGAFDCPDAGQSTAARRASTTPVQSLNLFNSKFTLEQSTAFADRVTQAAGSDLPRQISEAYLLSLNREPTDEERTESQNLVRDHGLAALCRVLFNTNEFLFLP